MTPTFFLEHVEQDRHGSGCLDSAKGQNCLTAHLLVIFLCSLQKCLDCSLATDLGERADRLPPHANFVMLEQEGQLGQRFLAASVTQNAYGITNHIPTFIMQVFMDCRYNFQATAHQNVLQGLALRGRFFTGQELHQVLGGFIA